MIEREKERRGREEWQKTEKENVRKGVNKPRRELLSFEGFFFQSIVSKSHFLANLEASKIHSTPYLKP